MAHSSPGRRLREAVADVTIQIPGAFNALVARMAEDHGFDAVYLSGAALSAGTLALPDVGLFTLTELATQAAYITRRVEIPLIVDADTGFGGPMNVERTVRELEAAGVAAIQLEDQELPKRCGHLSGKRLVDSAEMCAKSARPKPRQGCRSGDSGPNRRRIRHRHRRRDRAGQTLSGGRRDWIFPEALATRGDFERFAQAIDAPLVANMTEFGKSPLLSLEELADLGYAAVLYPVTLLRVAMKAVEAALATVASDGTQADLLDLMQTRQELYDMLGYEDYEARDRAYFQAAAPDERKP